MRGLWTHPDGLVETTTDDIRLVKLQARDRSHVSYERSVCLTRSH
jgi:hypothetical protein